MANWIEQSNDPNNTILAIVAPLLSQILNVDQEMNKLSVIIKLNENVSGLPYRNPETKQVDGIFTYWVQTELVDTLWTLFLDVDHDINQPESKEFHAVAHFMRDDLCLEDKLFGVLRNQKANIINGPNVLGEMTFQKD